MVTVNIIPLLILAIILLAVFNAVLTYLLLNSPYSHAKSREYQEMLEMKENGTAGLVKQLRLVEELKDLINDKKGHEDHIELRIRALEQILQAYIIENAKVGISKREK